MVSLINVCYHKFQMYISFFSSLQLERISTVKCNILRNEEKVQNLLAGVLLS